MSVIKQKKSKNIGYCPIDIQKVLCDKSDIKSTEIERFINSNSAEEQLTIIKNIGVKVKEPDPVVIQFLVTVYFHSPAKHPIKCFIVKYITKLNATLEPFAESLSQYILSQMIIEDFSQYSAVVFKTVLCIENFSAGVAAVKLIDHRLAEYMVHCLTGCADLLKDSNITPTKKSDIYTLEHSCLRLLVHIVQKLDSKNDRQNWSSIFVQFTSHIEQLIDDGDLPMDTKSLCGILFLYLEIIKHGGSSNISIVVTKLLSPDSVQQYHILHSRAGQLAVYSALATAARDQLHLNVDGTPAIVLLLEKLIQLGESGPPCQATDVGISRALCQLSRSLRGIHGAFSTRAAGVLTAAVCARLDHSADCVRHLAGDTLEALVDYCVYLEGRGDSSPLSHLLRSLRCLPRLSRARFLAARRAVCALPPRRALRDVCDAREIIEALDVPHLQPAARATLETLVSRHSLVADADEVFLTWAVPALDIQRPSDAALLAVLTLRPDLLPAITEYSREHRQSRWRVLVCARLAGLPWRHYVSRAALLAAAVHTDEQVRIQALSLVGQSQKTMEPFTDDELEFIRHFLRYNLNAHSTHFRQTVIALITKILERAARTGSVSLCVHVRAECVRHLRRGCAARVAAAAPLAAIAQHLCNHTGLIEWSADEVETLLQTLADSYEANQATALRIMAHCPRELLQKGYSTSLEVDDLLEQACSLRPADSLAAAYKLRLVADRLPDTVTVPNDMDVPATNAAAYVLCVRLGAAAEARLAGAFGPLHCLSALIRTIHERILTSEPLWLCLCERIISVCTEANEVASLVVSAASPEGYLPHSCNTTAYRESIRLEGGVVTAQVVLLCAWRLVKEASLLLGWVGGVLCGVRGGAAAAAGERLARLLRRCQHRGAFEQAHAGLASLLHRMCGVEALSRVVEAWLEELVRAVTCDTRAHVQTTRRSAGLPLLIQALLSSAPHKAGTVSRALLRTAVTGDTAVRRALALNVLCALFKHSTLEGATQPWVGEGLVAALRGADADEWPERTACHLLFGALCVRAFGVVRSRVRLDVRNTLPARVFFARYPVLYDAMLHKLNAAVSAERGSMSAAYPTLLILARLRPTLEGTTPHLKLSSFEGVVLQCAGSAVLKTRQLAAAAGVALLTPDRYLEDIQKTFNLLSSQATHTNYCHGLLLRLNALLEEVEIQEGIVTIQGDRVVRHLTKRVVQGNGVEILSDGRGVESQTVEVDQGGVTKLIDEVVKGSGVVTIAGVDQKKVDGLIDDRDQGRRVVSLAEGVGLINGVKGQETGKEVNVWGSTWILNQPCFLLIQEYAKVLQKMFHCYPGCLPGPLRSALSSCMEHLLRARESVRGPARGPALAACLHLHIELACWEDHWYRVVDICVRGLTHPCYEVVLSALEYIEGLYGTTEPSNGTVLALLRHRPEYFKLLSEGYHRGIYLQCRRKCVRLLSLENNTQKYIIDDLQATDRQIIETLLDETENSHIAEKHIFITSLLNYVSTKLDGEFVTYVLEATRLMYRLCLEENAEDVRTVVLDYLDANIKRILKVDLERLRDEDKFEYKATVICLLVILLEDDDYDTRQRASDVAVKMWRDVTTEACRDVTNEACRDVTNGACRDVTTEACRDVTNEACRDVTNGACRDVTTEACCDVTNEACRDFTNEACDVATKASHDVNSKVTTNKCDHTASDVTAKACHDDKRANVTSKVSHEDTASDVATETCDVTTKACFKNMASDVTKDCGNVTNACGDVTSDVTLGDTERVIPSVCGEMLRSHVSRDGDGVALLVIIGLLKFGGASADGGDEYRVFDQSDRNNLFVEEATWSQACAHLLTQIIPQNTLQTVIDIIHRQSYRQAIKTLCREHVDVFMKIVAGEICQRVVKIEDFVNIL